MSTFKDIASELKESALESGSSHLHNYLDKEEELLNLLSTFDGIKSEFYCNDTVNLNQISKLLATYSDFTSIITAPSTINDYQIEHFHTDHPKNITREVTVPESLTNSNLTKGYPILPCYIYKNDADTKKITRALNPFFSNGKFILRPLRTLLVQIPKISENSKAYSEIYFASSDTPNNHWFAKEINEKDSFSVYNGLKQFEVKSVFELTLPYFNNVSIENLSKILNEENDLLGTFRVTLKNLGKKIMESDNLSEYRNDVIRPEIETINRKFRTIHGLHSISVNASVATFTLSLIAIQISSNINFQTLFNTLLGSSAIGLIATETRYQTELDKLKDNPYFLLWKISNIKK